MSTLNKDRLIQIYKSSDTGWTWRDNLARLSSNFKNDRDYFINIKNLNELQSALTVNSNVELLMTGDIPGFGSKGSQSYGTPIYDALNRFGVNNIAKLGYEAASNIASSSGSSSTWMPWAQNAQAWTGSSGGVNISYTFSFSMGQYGLWNAKEEVIKPILNLIAPTLPKYLGKTNMEGPYPTTIGLLSDIIRNVDLKDSIAQSAKDLGSDVVGLFTDNKGNIASDAVSSAGATIKRSLEDLGGIIETLVMSAYENYTYTVKFGRMQEFRQMMIQDSSVTFSNQVDQFGFPISGTCTLSMVGIAPPALSYDSSHNDFMIGVPYKKRDRTSIKFGIQL